MVIKIDVTEEIIISIGEEIAYDKENKNNVLQTATKEFLTNVLHVTSNTAEQTIVEVSGIVDALERISQSIEN